MPKITGEPKHPRANRLYNAEWESLPEFRGWLGQSTEEEKGARCKLCQKDLRCHLFDIKKHSETKKHRDLAGDIPEEAYDALPRRQSIPLHAKGPRQASFLEIQKSYAGTPALFFRHINPAKIYILCFLKALLIHNIHDDNYFLMIVNNNIIINLLFFPGFLGKVNTSRNES